MIRRHVHLPSQPGPMLHRIASVRLFTRPGSLSISTSLERAQASSDALDRLRASMKPLYEHQWEKIKYIRENGDVPIMQVTPKHLLNGMRGVPTLVWDVSSVDAKKGIRYRGIKPEDLIERLPKGKGSEIPSVESLFWLLTTGCMPSAEDEAVLRRAMVTTVPFDNICDTICKAIDNLPAGLHPMTLFTIGVLTAQQTSSFSDAYSSGIANKSNLWEFALIDGIKLLAHLPIIAAYVYRKQYMPHTIATFREDVDETSRDDIDWAARFSILIGNKDPMVHDLLRLYVLLHADHEGGNASAHTANIVSSAHADPFLAFGAAMCGLAGPLHGLANQDSLRWLHTLKKTLEDLHIDWNDTAELRKRIRDYADMQVKSGKVIPGYGHAVLRTIDPRFLALKKWGEKNAADDPLIKLNLICAEEVPKILAANPKVSNPYPNVDCGSGTALYFCGIREPEFFTVIFGFSRSVGILASIVWARIFKSPLERPKSLTIDGIQRAIDKQLRKQVSESSP